MKIENLRKFKNNCRLNGILYALRSFGKNKDYNYYSNLKSKYYKKELKEWYYNRTHDILNLRNPKNFNQKIQYLKMYDSTEIKSLLTDKYENRSWIMKNIGKQYLVPLLGVWDRFDDIDFDKLPNQFVLKCNHGSSFNYIVNDKSKIDMKELKEKFNYWMNTNFTFVAGFELHYNAIKPKIICEEYLGSNLVDLQVWCANGNILFLSYIYSPHGENKKITFDENWNKLDFYTSLPIYEGNVEKPRELNKIIQISKKVSKEFKFIRVDFYITNKNQILISELTFTPASGCCGWYPEEINKIMGEKIKI